MPIQTFQRVLDHSCGDDAEHETMALLRNDAQRFLYQESRRLGRRFAIDRYEQRIVGEVCVAHLYYHLTDYVNDCEMR